METDSVRNRALLQGAVWTAALAAALALLKFPGTGPIALVSLTVAGVAVVGVIWAVILARALKRQQQTARALLADAAAAEREAIDNMAEITCTQMSGARAEMLRADQLLGDAIDRLVLVFEKITEQARAQSELAQATPAATELREAAERVASDVNSAVMALQFRDMVGQKLGHVREKLVAAEEAMYEIRLASAQAAEAAAAGMPDAPSPAELAAQVRDRLKKLQQAEATTPVRQQLMHAGDVELF